MEQISKGSIVERKSKYDEYKGITGKVIDVVKRYGKQKARVQWNRATGSMKDRSITTIISIDSIRLAKSKKRD